MKFEKYFMQKTKNIEKTSKKFLKNDQLIYFFNNESNFVFIYAFIVCKLNTSILNSIFLNLFLYIQQTNVILSQYQQNQIDELQTFQLLIKQNIFQLFILHQATSINMFGLQKHIFIIILIVQFWISGLFVLSVIFTYDDGIDDLTLFTFIAYAIGSFIAGIISDIYGRKLIFIISSILLAISAVLILFQPFCGYIFANLAIGPLNNLTFVYINETYPQKAEKYTIFVLIGWAFSEVTLGVFFLLSNTQVFNVMLLIVTTIYMVLAIFHVKQTQQFLKNQLQNKNQLKNQSQKNQYNSEHKIDSKLINYHATQNPSLMTKKSFFAEKVLPSSLKPLISCSILMFTMQMFYYRTQFTLDNFGVSLEINTIVVGCTEIFANCLFTKVIQSMKRRLALRVLILSLMGLLVFLIFSPMMWIQTMIEGFMRLVDTAIMIVLGIYIPELFSSKQKGRGTNFIMSFGVIGSALNGKLFSHLPFWSLELFLLCALGMTLLLKQTNNKYHTQENQVKSIQKQSLQDSLMKSENDVYYSKNSENL